MKYMRKKLYVLPLILIIFFMFTGFKGGSGFQIEVDDSYAVATEKKEVTAVAERLGVDEKDVKTYFSKNHLKFIAVSKDKMTQIRVAKFADTRTVTDSATGEEKDLIATIYDSENLTDEQLSQIILLYSNVQSTATVVESNGRKFAKTTEVLEDSGGVYTTTQYLTIAGGRTYIITCYNPGEETSDEVEKIFSTFTATDMTTRINDYESKKKWVIPLIILLCGIVGVSVFGICRSMFKDYVAKMLK